MKINLWSINYYPELTGIGVYNTGLCDYLADCGDEVNVVTTFAYYPQWQKRKEDEPALYRHEIKRTDKGKSINVYRLWHYVPAKPTVLKRIFHEYTFVKTSFLQQLFLPAPDIYIVVSPPLLLGFAAWILSLIKARPYLFHVQDLQPDAAMGLGMLKPGLFTSILLWFERIAYDKAFRVSAISKKMCALIAGKTKEAGKIICFPNWADENYKSAAEPASKTKSWKETNGYASNCQLISYAGNLGVKQGLETVLQAASLINELNASSTRDWTKEPARASTIDIEFAIVGAGAAENNLREFAQRKNLTNVRFFPLQDEVDHTALLEESAICLIPQKPGSFSSFLPSKLLKILALGRPVLTNADKESALYDAVSEGQFGLSVPPDDAGAMAEAIMSMLASPAQLERMCENGKQFVKQFEKTTVLSKFRQTLEEALKQR